MPRLLLATNNSGKVRELRDLLAESGWDPVIPSALGIALEPDEPGMTYAENAAIKARAFAAASGLVALADDSGLELDALNGAPGVRSARYGGPGLSDSDRVDRLLAALHDVPEAGRTARFRSAIAITAPDGRVWQADGICEGHIIAAPRGVGGFGYDPIFLLSEYGRTMAELPEALKNQVSHRARAVQAALPVLRSLACDSTLPR
ncbi:MAG: RdgB/HAM1 family non-canonical purine NTP pyrophosphatase [Dehalococcoidia bacterium]